MTHRSHGRRTCANVGFRDFEELHRAAFASISDAVLLTDDDGRFTYVCPNVHVVFGYSPAEVYALGSIDSLLGGRLFATSELGRRGEIRNIEHEVAIKHGERRVVSISVKAVSIDGGTRLYCCHDVTELRHAEAELRAAREELTHASRLVLVGRLTASIGHEIAQPLTTIIGDASAGLGMLERGDGGAMSGVLGEILSDIVSAGRRATDIVERIGGLVRKRPLLFHALNVNDVANDALRFLSGEAKRRCILVEAELENALPPVRADRICLQQVLLGLFLNAMDAMDRRDVQERRLLLYTRRIDDGVEVVVADSGQGIAPDALSNVFDAFFTTKQDGIGLGLAIAKSIVDAHNGSIWAENRGEGGAAFHVALPACGTSANA